MKVVDRRSDALGGGEVGIAQREPQVGQAIEREVDLALDDRAVRDAPDGRHAARDLCGIAFGREPADRERALPDRIDIAVGAEQRRDQQRAALQAFRVAHRRDGDVDARALRPEGGQVGGHHDGCDVAGAQRLAADVDAEALQHRLQRLLGEGDVVERVAGAVEADDEAVADELVLAHALDAREILDPRGGVGWRGRAQPEDDRERGNPGSQPHGLLPVEGMRVSQRAGCNAVNHANAVPTGLRAISI